MLPPAFLPPRRVRTPRAPFGHSSTPGTAPGPLLLPWPPGSRKRVKNRDLPVRIEQRLVLMLAVDVEQQGRKSFYLRDIACLAIDAADAAGSGDLSEIITCPSSEPRDPSLLTAPVHAVFGFKDQFHQRAFSPSGSSRGISSFQAPR